MALYVTRPRRDEERIGRGLPSVNATSTEKNSKTITGLIGTCQYMKKSQRPASNFKKNAEIRQRIHEVA